MITKMGVRIKEALSWYDTASKKYRDSLQKLKELREKIDRETPEQQKRIYSENPVIKQQKEKVRRYEEKLFRASTVLHNITTVMDIIEHCDGSKEIILGFDEDDDDD